LNNLNIGIIRKSEYVLISVEGDLDLEGAAELKALLKRDFSIEDSVPQDFSHLVIDFSGAGAVSSSGIGLLASLQRSFNNSKKKMTLVKIPDPLRQSLIVTRLIGVFRICDDLAEAIR